MREIMQFVFVSTLLLLLSSPVQAGHREGCQANFKAKAYEDARISCSSAMRLGSLDAMIALGIMHAAGLGVEKDCAGANSLLRLAAHSSKHKNPKSVAFARIALGQLHADPRSLCPELRNPAIAEMWYFLAFASDGLTGVKHLSDIEREMKISQSDISDGRTWAQNWLKVHPE
jgi:TPR repeat protein